MSYIHRGKAPVILINDPIDPDSSDWVFFVYDEWVRDGESITVHSSDVTGGTADIESTYLGAMTGEDGTNYELVYGVKVRPIPGSTAVITTHRVSTTASGSTDIGRTSMDRTAVIPVRSL